MCYKKVTYYVKICYCMPHKSHWFTMKKQVTPWRPACFEAKTNSFHMSLHENFSKPKVLESCSNPQKTQQVWVCNEKKFFGFAFQIFCEWHHKWRCFRPFWPTSSGPRPKLLDSSISLKFLLETRLKSKSFDSLDNLLGFRVQKLLSKLNKVISSPFR